jgi:hypothetical protein
MLFSGVIMRKAPSPSSHNEKERQQVRPNVRPAHRSREDEPARNNAKKEGEEEMSDSTAEGIGRPSEERVQEMSNRARRQRTTAARGWHGRRNAR